MMKPVVALCGAFALGASLATAVAVAIGHFAATKHASARDQRDMQGAALAQVAENALRNPLFLPRAEGAKGEPTSLVEFSPVIAAATPAVTTGVATPGSTAAKPPSANGIAAASTAIVKLVAAPQKPAEPPAASASATRSQPAGPALSAPISAEPAAAGQPELGKVLASVPVEGVSYEKAAVSRLERGAVQLSGGGRIVVGQNFPSGETLLVVDPENSRIVTNRRQILLFGPAR